MEQKFIVTRINGEWMVEGDCVDLEFPKTLKAVHELLDISAEQMLFDENREDES